MLGAAKTVDLAARDGLVLQPPGGALISSGDLHRHLVSTEVERMGFLQRGRGPPELVSASISLWFRVVLKEETGSGLWAGQPLGTCCCRPIECSGH